MPNSLIEAMSLGLACISTDCPCGGPRTVMTDGKNGLLIPIKDKDALVKGINRLIEDRELAERLGEEAAKIEDITNSEAIFIQWRDYLDKVISDFKKK